LTEKTSSALAAKDDTAMVATGGIDLGVGAGIKFERFPTLGLRSKMARLIQHAAQT
jgi:hypothetical protein